MQIIDDDQGYCTTCACGVSQRKQLFLSLFGMYVGFVKTNSLTSYVSRSQLKNCLNIKAKHGHLVVNFSENVRSSAKHLSPKNGSHAKVWGRQVEWRA